MARKITLSIVGQGENFEKTRRLLQRNKAEFKRMTKFVTGEDNEESVEMYIIDADVPKKRAGKIQERVMRTNLCREVVVKE